MEGGIFEAGKDMEKIQFQQELSRWFESRGVIADLRSHLRHLMITALQSSQVGMKPTDRSSPKAQAVNLMVAEYLLRHRCHYTLSVFTSEVPTLASFSLEPGLQDTRAPGPGRNRPGKNYFQETEVEEMFNALGLSSCQEELALVKGRYLEKGNEVSLVELFLQMAVDMAIKQQIQENLESHVVEGERVLSREWSSRVVDVLLAEKVAPSQVSTLEEAIFRITENEVRRSLEEQHRAQLQMLSEREKRIQECLRKHEEEMLIRLLEAKKELTTRKDAMEEELTEREKHLTKMALEWNNKHEEIRRLSKKFHDVESENRNFKKKLKDLEEENKHLRREEESQRRRVQELRGQLDSSISKLKEATDSNAVLSERLQVLMARETKEVLLRQDSANQATARGNIEIPLLWSKSRSLDADSSHHNKEEFGLKLQSEELIARDLVPPQEHWNLEKKTTPAEAVLKKSTCKSDSSEDGEDGSLSSSFGDIIHGVQEKLHVLEEESNRLNQSYLEYKLKCISIDSDSEASNDPLAKSPSPVPGEIGTTEAKFCQTNVDETFIKIQKLKESRRTKFEFDDFASKKSDLSPKKPTLPTPTKRQLRNREFYLKSRHLFQQLEKEQPKELQTSLLTADSYSSSSGEEFTASSQEKNQKPPVKSVSLTLLRTSSVRGDERLHLKSPAESIRKPLLESSSQLPKSDADCLALLEDARIKTPQASARPLRQEMLLSESEREEAEEDTKEKETRGNFPLAQTSFSGRLSTAKETGNDGFW